MYAGHQHVTILIVDDDPGHCELVRRNLRRVGISNTIKIVHSAGEALDFVFGRGADRAQSAAADLLMLLDINMPGGLNGLDVLREVKSNAATRRIPVIMLTTTDDPKEVNLCYELGCSVYITKPVAPIAFIESINRLGMFIEVVSLPSAGNPDPSP